MTDVQTPDTELVRAMVPDVRQLAPNLVVAGVLPIVAYVLLRPHVGSDTIALAAVLTIPLAEVGFERVHRGRFEPVGMLALIGISVGLLGAIAFHGDPLLLKVKDSLLTGLFGVVCLASLNTRRPAMFHLGRSFATAGDPDKQTQFDKMWALPGVAHRFQIVTVVWGATLVAEAVLRTVLALSLPTQTFLVLAQIVNWATLGALLAFTVVYSRSGERRLATLLANSDEATPDQRSGDHPQPPKASTARSHQDPNSL